MSYSIFHTYFIFHPTIYIAYHIFHILYTLHIPYAIFNSYPLFHIRFVFFITHIPHSIFTFISYSTFLSSITHISYSILQILFIFHIPYTFYIVFFIYTLYSISHTFHLRTLAVAAKTFVTLYVKHLLSTLQLFAVSGAITSRWARSLHYPCFFMYFIFESVWASRLAGARCYTLLPIQGGEL
jgi:hypothetical protein